MSGFTQWGAGDATEFIAIPRATDDKYSRGVLGLITGSVEYPGAAVLGVEAALRTGVGMVRYLGPEVASILVLQRRPEAVTVPGRVQSWLLGSGIDATTRDATTTERMRAALSEGVPVVLDAGALDLLGNAGGPVVITPHFRELGRLIAVDPGAIAADPALWCARAAERLGATVLLKGSRSYVCSPGGSGFVTPVASSWLATAGTGDVLGGILGALVATHEAPLQDDAAQDDEHSLLARLAASAAVIHAEAGSLAGAGGPVTALDVAAALPETIARLLREHPRA